MNANLTELIFILDRSGSMAGLESDTIGGFNSLIEKQKSAEGTAYVTTVLFDDKYELLHDRADIKGIKPLTEKDYYVRGMTALMDAIGKSIAKTTAAFAHIEEEALPAKVMMVITTDGMENASREYNSDSVKKLIEAKKKEGWEFVFLGANIDAVQTASKMGIPADMAVDYHADKAGTTLNFCVLNEAVSRVRSGRSLEADWAKEIRADHKNRKKDN